MDEPGLGHLLRACRLGPGGGADAVPGHGGILRDQGPDPEASAGVLPKADTLDAP